MTFKPLFGQLPDVSDPSAYWPDGVPMLRMPEICRRAALSPSTIYALIDRMQFPVLLELAPRARGLPAHVLDAWLWSRLLARAEMSRLRDPVALPFWGVHPVVVPPVSDIFMLRRWQVLARVGLAKSVVYDAIGDETFPAPAPVTVCARRWASHEIQTWIDQRTARSLRQAKARLRRSNLSVLPPPSRPVSNGRSQKRSRSKRRRG